MPANDPSYRMVRDSRRLELAQQLETASRQAYLAARRAEYEYTARLSANNFRISDIYKARTANDILIFLQNFDFTLSSASNGLINQVVTQDYGFYWLHKVAGIGQPKASNNGFGINLVSGQSGDLGYRQVRVSQSGQVGLTSFAGCLFDYRLIPPAALLGLEFPSNQPTDVATGVFNGDINAAHGNSAPGYSTPAFLGRPLASNGWRIVINAGSPNGILPDMDLQQLNDIELKISTTYASRSVNSQPQPSQCVRADY